MTAEISPPQPTTIQKLSTAVYPSFAMLAGMQLDLFTPLANGPRRRMRGTPQMGVFHRPLIGLSTEVLLGRAARTPPSV
jgi:hypothetical protein